MAVTHHQVTIEARNVIVSSLKYFIAKKKHYYENLTAKRESKFVISLTKLSAPLDPFSTIDDVQSD